MPKIERIDHVAIVVEDIEASLSFWRDGLGLELSHVQDVPSEKSVVAFLPTGGSEIELVKPTVSDSGLARFLEKRGPGMHHVCLAVDDIEAMLAHLKARNIQLINETALVGAEGMKYAFIHPKSTGGVLVELYETKQRERGETKRGGRE